MISEIIWAYVLTHTPEECMELQRQVEETHRICERLYPPPRPIETDHDR